MDDFVAQHKIDRLDFIKADIQGAEPLLFEGARETLARLGPEITMEVSPEDLAKGAHNSRELVSLLEILDYEVFALDNGRRGGRIRAEDTAPDFFASSVVCRKRGSP